MDDAITEYMNMVNNLVDAAPQMSDPRVALDLATADAELVLEELRHTIARWDCGLIGTREALAEALAWFTVEGA